MGRRRERCETAEVSIFRTTLGLMGITPDTGRFKLHEEVEFRAILHPGFDGNALSFQVVGAATVSVDHCAGVIRVKFDQRSKSGDDFKYVRASYDGRTVEARLTVSLFDLLWEKHPKNQGIPNPCLDNEGQPTYDNQCAIRMGLSLMDSGIHIPNEGLVRCDKHGRRHVLRAQELANWLKRSGKLGNRTIYKGRSSDQYEHFAKKNLTGVVFFKDFWQRQRQDGSHETLEEASGDHIDLVKEGILPPNQVLKNFFNNSVELWLWSVY